MPLAASALGLWLLAAPADEPDLDLLEALGGEEAEVMLNDDPEERGMPARDAAPCDVMLENEAWSEPCPESVKR